MNGVLPSITTKSFAFTVEHKALKWDVYHFVTSHGKRGTLAFTQCPDGRWLIGLLQTGTLTEEQVMRALAESEN